MNAHQLGQLRHHELLALVFTRHWRGDSAGLVLARMSREQLIALLLKGGTP